MRAALISILFFSLQACGSVHPGEPDADSPIDAADDAVLHADAANQDAAPPPPAVWQNPEIVTAVNGNIADLMPSLTADGLQMFFVRHPDGVFDPTPPKLFVSSRTSLSAAWSTPVEIARGEGVTDPDTLDGLEVYGTKGTSVVRMARASRDAPWSEPTAQFSGRQPSLTDDGLTIYYFVTSGTQVRHRNTTGSAWGPEAAVTITYLKYLSVSVEPDEKAAALSDPALDGLPEVSIVTRLDGGAWSDPVAVPTLMEGIESCELATPNELYCAIRVGNGATTDIVRVVRE